MDKVYTVTKEFEVIEEDESQHRHVAHEIVIEVFEHEQVERNVQCG